MKKLLALTLVSSFFGLSFSGETFGSIHVRPGKDRPLYTRTLNARQATSTASPDYAERELREREDAQDSEKEWERERSNEHQHWQERMEEQDMRGTRYTDPGRQSEFDGGAEDQSRTRRTRHALDTGREN
jgi:hypothetical protein